MNTLIMIGLGIDLVLVCATIFLWAKAHEIYRTYSSYRDSTPRSERERQIRKRIDLVWRGQVFGIAAIAPIYKLSTYALVSVISSSSMVSVVSGLIAFIYGSIFSYWLLTEAKSVQAELAR